MTQTAWLYKTLLELLPLVGTAEGLTTSQLTRALNECCRRERDGIYQEPFWPGYSVQTIDARCRDAEIRDQVVARGGFRWRKELGPTASTVERTGYPEAPDSGASRVGEIPAAESEGSTPSGRPLQVEFEDNGQGVMVLAKRGR